MKKLLMPLFLSILFFSCEKERDLQSEIIQCASQNDIIYSHNRTLLNHINQSEKAKEAHENLKDILDSFQEMKNELVMMSGGYTDSISGNIANKHKEFPVEKYFYRDNKYRSFALNHYWHLIDRLNKEMGNKSFEEAFPQQEFQKQNDLFKENMFKEKNTEEALLILNLTQQRVLLDIQNILIKELQEEG